MFGQLECSLINRQPVDRGGGHRETLNRITCVEVLVSELRITCKKRNRLCVGMVRVDTEVPMHVCVRENNGVVCDYVANVYACEH